MGNFFAELTRRHIYRVARGLCRCGVGDHPGREQHRPHAQPPECGWHRSSCLGDDPKRPLRDPEKMRGRRETVEHPFGTIKARMGATHFLMKTLPKVATEMALSVLAYNLTRVMNILGIQPLLAAMRA